MNPTWLFAAFSLLALTMSSPLLTAQELTTDEWESIRQLERQRIDAIDKVFGSVVAIYDPDRQGGGSGVIIHPSGIALTNHHVIMGSGVEGWGGLADGKLYPWTLVGTDPGGDVAVIQLEGLDGEPAKFPFARLGDSDKVQVGDWALAMGNPFVLTEDQKPTVTLGIVSGVKRYQPGAGSNQLVYGNCIQVDSSINPGNSGGPLFNLDGEVIGINGRGSFQDRGRVNVGLGYAISSNQIKNFLPDLLATKLVEHGSLDASFSDRDGRVVCSTINRDAPIAVAGLDLGDELLEFEGIPISNANQFTNLICTLPEDWPAHLVVRGKSGARKEFHVRLFGLPYRRPPRPTTPPGREPTPEEKKKIARAKQMFQLLAAEPGVVRNENLNRHYANLVCQDWQRQHVAEPTPKVLHLVDQFKAVDGRSGDQQMWIAPTGAFRVKQIIGQTTKEIVFDGKSFALLNDGQPQPMTITEAKLEPLVLQAMGIHVATHGDSFSFFGEATIDGSDKANRLPAFRFKLLDRENDWFYFWLQLGSATDEGLIRLAKASANKDCDDAGGIIFEQWVASDGWRIPNRRLHVVGLAEDVVVQYVNRSAELVEMDIQRFSVPTQPESSE